MTIQLIKQDVFSLVAEKTKFFTSQISSPNPLDVKNLEKVTESFIKDLIHLNELSYRIFVKQPIKNVSLLKDLFTLNKSVLIIDDFQYLKYLQAIEYNIDLRLIGDSNMSINELYSHLSLVDLIRFVKDKILSEVQEYQLAKWNEVCV